MYVVMILVELAHNIHSTKVYRKWSILHCTWHCFSNISIKWVGKYIVHGMVNCPHKKYKNRLACSANITSMTRYLDQYCNDEYVTRNAFVKKLLKEPEIKLKEFNFKILHGILPCNSNLKKWKIRSVDVCDVCNQIQTIEHLLYGCCYVKPLWQRINAGSRFRWTF